MNHARNIRHDSRRFPFFQPDMFIAETHIHRQGTYQTEYEPAKKYLVLVTILVQHFLFCPLHWPEFHPADDAVASRRGSMTSVKRERGGAKNGGKRTGERKRGREGGRGLKRGQKRHSRSSGGGVATRGIK